MFQITKFFGRLKSGIIYCRSLHHVRSYSFLSNEIRTYCENKYMRRVLRKTNGCVLFDPKKSVKNLDPAILSVVSLVKNRNRSNYEVDQNLLSAASSQCLKNHGKWALNTRLFALDAWQFVKGARRFAVFQAILKTFLNEFDQLERGPALQTMYYVAWSKQRLDANEKAIVINTFEENINGLTLDEISIYCLALIKSQTDVKSVSLAKSLYDHLMKNNLHEKDDIAVTGVLKAVRHFSTIDHIDELTYLQNSLVPFAKKADLTALTHVIQLGSKQRVFNSQLIEVVLERFLANLDKLRTKDAERALLAISTLNRTQTELEKKFCEQVQSILLESLDTHYGPQLIRCISYLTTCRVVDPKLIDWALNPKTHSLIYGAAIKGDERHFLVIDSYAKINLAGRYHGHKLPEHLCAELMTKVCEFEVAAQKSELVDKISNILKMNGSHCILSRPFPYVPFPDIFLVYNKRTNKTVSTIKPHIDGTIIKASDFHLNNPYLEAVAIIPCSKHQSVFKSDRFNGLFQLKLDQLQMLGFKTIVIKKSMWNLCKNADAQRRFLALELGIKDVVLLNKCLNIVSKSNKNRKAKNKC